ncbi:MAG: tail fiber protein [Bacteroidetes Order II. Incertae sedis bacterium]|nr:tail fiber protein [Bacteroidetes Order II. bacterium]
MKNAWQESETYLDDSAHENANEAYFTGSPYVGEIQIFAGNFAPEGWMFCHEQFIGYFGK